MKAATKTCRAFKPFCSGPPRPGEKLTPQAGKGFGLSQPESRKGNGNKDMSGSSKAVKKALKLVDKENKTKSWVRPIDPKEAAQGRLDIAQVKDWGTADTKDAGELKLQKLQMQYSNSRQGTFYEQLARQLQLAEAQGTLTVAGPSPPPLQKWSFKLDRYLQYLVDQQLVHSSLEAALKRSKGLVEVGAAKDLQLLEVSQETVSGTVTTPAQPASSHKPQAPDVSACTATTTQALHALESFMSSASSTEHQPELQGQQCGLERAAYIARDIDQLLRAHSASSQLPQRPDASPAAKSYAKFLDQQGSLLSSQSLPSSEKQEAGLKLLAHAYVIHMVHLASGIRFGAAAAEKLRLFELDAVQFYKGYPQFVKDPVSLLKQVVNTAGSSLDITMQDYVFAELPSAMHRTSSLIMSLARED